MFGSRVGLWFSSGLSCVFLYVRLLYSFLGVVCSVGIAPRLVWESSSLRVVVDCHFFHVHAFWMSWPRICFFFLCLLFSCAFFVHCAMIFFGSRVVLFFFTTLSLAFIFLLLRLGKLSLCATMFVLFTSRFSSLAWSSPCSLVYAVVRSHRDSDESRLLEPVFLSLRVSVFFRFVYLGLFYSLWESSFRRPVT